MNDNGAYDRLRLEQTATLTVDGKSGTILCRCCEGHADYLVRPARVCLWCGGFCECGGCQSDSREKVRDDA